MIKTCCMRFAVFTTEIRGHGFLFLILDDKIPNFTCIKFERKTDIKLRSEVISKPSDTNFCII